MTTTKDDILIVADSNRGCYIPQFFAEHWLGLSSTALPDGYMQCLLDGPDQENNPDYDLYWETWEWVLDSVTIKYQGRDYSIYHDGDVFLVALDIDPNSEGYKNLFGDAS